MGAVYATAIVVALLVVAAALAVALLLTKHVAGGRYGG
eukprot:gene40950-11624_t